jgi:MSHA biogenesis protein MshO
MVRALSSKKDLSRSEAGCTFIHDPNQGATQQGGFVWLRLELSRAGESAALAHGVHVDNVP